MRLTTVETLNLHSSEDKMIVSLLKYLKQKHLQNTEDYHFLTANGKTIIVVYRKSHEHFILDFINYNK